MPGCRGRQMGGTRTGVFIGGLPRPDYLALRLGDPAVADAYFMTGATLSTLANRISYVFDLKGPSFTVDTACSSSLVALHVACASMRRGEIDFRSRGWGQHAAGAAKLRRFLPRIDALSPRSLPRFRRGRGRLCAGRGRRRHPAQAAQSSARRCRPDPLRHRGHRDQFRWTHRRAVAPEPERAGRVAARGLCGIERRSKRPHLCRGARDRDSRRRPHRGGRIGRGAGAAIAPPSCRSGR